MSNLSRIVLTKKAQKDVLKVPSHIKTKLLLWVSSVELFGIQKMRTVPGYFDKALKGDRFGQRSIRLSRGYRAFYSVSREKNIELISIEEVNKHEY
ncbi:MAG: type II toxin-antitoxin system mRNA interferase toxin, RelE/StbE family [Legionella sp.]|nr:type II toxin-antitoxin system mRNA interferase toxin, RelE/StbE family [Legionella sp.]